MSNCEEPDETGGCTNCGKCGKGREETRHGAFLPEHIRDNHLTSREAYRFQDFQNADSVLMRHLLVLNNILPEPALEESNHTNPMER